jgi:hypothetical protein
MPANHHHGGNHMARQIWLADTDDSPEFESKEAAEQFERREATLEAVEKLWMNCPHTRISKFMIENWDELKKIIEG